MKYVFGPVPSWRLGQSLGIDPVPLKTCNWNCVYCQLGRSQPVTAKRARYVPEHDLIEEVKTALAAHEDNQIDWLTFVGSGETLLHAKIGCMLRELKDLTDKPIAVITNGSLLCQPYVRWELSVADAVLPSLDVGTDELYRRLNRPHRAVSFERHVEGLARFRDEYDGKLWTEVMLVKGVNDSDTALSDTASQLKRVRPDEIHVNGPSRSPVEPWVECPDADAVTRAAKVFESIARVRVAHSAVGVFELGEGESVLDSVIQILTRHPMSHANLERALEQWAPDSVHEILAQLIESGRAQRVNRGGVEFWVAANTHFPDSQEFQTTAVGV